MTRTRKTEVLEWSSIVRGAINRRAEEHATSGNPDKAEEFDALEHGVELMIANITR